MSLLLQFGKFIETSQTTPFSPEVIAHAQRAFLDWHSALIAGATTPVAAKLRVAFSDELGLGVCALAGTTQKSSARMAAFINGTISHIAEYDDIYRDGAYHPACPTISAALALAEYKNISLTKLYAAIIVGYEVSTRIAEVIQPSHYEFFHTTGTVGVFGSAAACAYLLNLDARQACDALATAGTFASGLQQAFRSDAMTKPMHAGHAAEVGLSAALTAQAGMTGTPDLLEGAAGFGAALTRGARWENLFEGLGETFNITRVTFKNHGCCGHNFPAIDAVAYLLDQHQLHFSQIQSIQVGAYKPTVEVCAYRHPKSAFEAKFSLSYTVSARAVLGRVREQAFTSAALQDPRIAALEKTVSLTLDEECARKFPKNRTAKVAIELKDGRIFKHHQLTRHGDPDDPLSNPELLDKFHELVAPRLGLQPAQKLADLLLGSARPAVQSLTCFWNVNLEVQP